MYQVSYEYTDREDIRFSISTNSRMPYALSDKLSHIEKRLSSTFCFLYDWIHLELDESLCTTTSTTLSRTSRRLGDEIVWDTISISVIQGFIKNIQDFCQQIILNHDCESYSRWGISCFCILHSRMYGICFDITSRCE